MRGMPFNLQGQGVIKDTTGTTIAAKAAAAAARREVTVEVERSSLWSGVGNKKEGGRIEPRSVLDHRRSPSPPTSTSTLSSSLGGGGGSTDTAGVAAVSDNPLQQKWVPSDTTSVQAASSGMGEGRKEECLPEFQLQPVSMEIGPVGGGDKCGGLGVEDWESMLSEAPVVAAASRVQDQSFLRWIMGDVEDSSSMGLKHQQQQMLSQVPVSVPGEFDAGCGGDAGGFGLIDSGFEFEHMEGFGGGVGAASLAAASSSISAGGGFPLMSSSGANSRLGNRILPISTSTTLPNIKNPFFGGNSNTIFPSPAMSTANSFSLPPGMFFSEPMEEKPPLFITNHMINNQPTHGSQNPSFFLPLNLYAQQEQQQQQQQSLLVSPHPKRHHSMANSVGQISPKIPFSNPGQDLFLRRHQPQHHQQQQQQSFGSFHEVQQRPMKPKLAGDEPLAVTMAAAHQHQQQQHQALVDQLSKAAELIEAGNSVNAREILARLNHQLSPPGKPLIRSAFYFKEALDTIVGNNNSIMMDPSLSMIPATHSKAPATPLDVVLKLNAYKNFSEISPVVQFTNFTCIQVLLEEISGCDHIHIVDFDIGVGGQWSSFMQELSQRRCSTAATAPSLKITALVTPSSHHHLELILTRENLTHFASELGIPFGFNILSLDSFDPSVILNMSSGYNEAIAVNIPISSSFTSTPSILRLIKQLSPKIVVSVDHNCDRSDLTFSQHFLSALHSYTILLESIDAAGANLDVVNKIEKYLLQPRIESVVLGRHRVADKKPQWRSLFASTGFVPLHFSNFTETQAECLLKRIQVRGFHVEKRQSSLLLLWQHRELISVSAWKC